MTFIVPEEGSSIHALCTLNQTFFIVHSQTNLVQTQRSIEICSQLSEFNLSWWAYAIKMGRKCFDTTVFLARKQHQLKGGRCKKTVHDISYQFMMGWS